MKKSIKILICIFIMLSIISLDIYATVVPSADNTLNEIATYWSENGGDLSNVNNTILLSWYSNMYKNLPVSSINNQDNKSKAYSAIIKELEKRNIDPDDKYNFKDIETEGDINYWKPTTGNNDELTDMAGKILGIIQVLGSVVSVLALVVIGIKYMLGSVEEKAKYKETMLPYIVGCIMLFAITNIATTLYKIGRGL